MGGYGSVPSTCNGMCLWSLALERCRGPKQPNVSELYVVISFILGSITSGMRIKQMWGENMEFMVPEQQEICLDLILLAKFKDL